MSVVVMTLAIPKPCGTISNHKWNAAVFSSHKATSVAANTVRRHENRVRLYNLPVRRITLKEVASNLAATKLRSEIHGCAARTHHPANTLPVEIAICEDTVNYAFPTSNNFDDVQSEVINEILG